MNKLLRGFVWFYELFTPAKSFRTNPILGNPTLNKLGLHVIRLWFGHNIMRFRMWLFSFAVSPEDHQQYQQQGFIIKENYLDEEAFQRLEQEIRAFHSTETRYCNQGDTKTQRTLLDPDTLQQLPEMAKLTRSKAFRRLMRYTAGHAMQPVMHIEKVHNGARKHEKDQATNEALPTDPQKNLHADTFHPTMKFWLFIDDVEDHIGPFTYVPGSNQLTQERMRWEYKMSQQAGLSEDAYTAKGSFRFSTDDLYTLKLPAPKKLQVKRNTLVIANTFGIHGRGQAKAGTTRLAIWGMSRTNPFLMFPGLPFERLNRLQYRVFNKQRKRADLKASANGHHASWYKTES